MAAALPEDGTPFVLLDDARTAGAAPARLYVDPVEIVTTRKSTEIPAALEALRTATRGGLHVAGYLSYEAGHALAGSRVAVRPTTLPLLWFGLFRSVEAIAPEKVLTILPDPHGAWIGASTPAINLEAYGAALAQVQALIEAGDIYQANLTFPAEAATAGDPRALYAGLRARAAAGYGGIVHTGQDWLLSLSPELFFSARDGRLTARPMKGTARRETDPAADAAAARALADDEKQRAENLMIVDLMRNDLSRVAVAGSVEVPRLFHVETYPTVHQMVSTVTATLAPTRDAVDALAALFPCGSITGAPKLRAMQVIDAVEAAPRGAYTGSIGRIDAGGDDAAFNVAIRTLHWQDDRAQLGLGSGIVADSQLGAEWAECLAKGAFVASRRGFDLIETMAFDPHDGLRRLDAHLTRMKVSATRFGFTFDRHAARNELQAATFRLRDAARIRLLLARSGAMSIECTPPPPVPSGPVDVAIVPLPVEPTDLRLRHKTTDRAFYDEARRMAGTFEVLFVDRDGGLTEGTFTSLFVERDGTLLTPTAGPLLGGILRNELIAQGRAREATLRADDLKQGFFIGNSLRGLLPARLVRL